MRFRDTRLPATSVDLMEFAHTAAVSEGQSFRRPTGEWPTTLFHVDADGKRHISQLRMPTTQASAALSIQIALKASRSVEALLRASAWEAFVPREFAGSADVNCGGLAGGAGPDFDAERDGVEVLLFLHVGDGFAVTRSARVLRHPAAPPVLGALSEITGEGLDVGGIFADALRLGIG
jgi:hypothetical protein